jgi:hypothetical protein
VVSVRNDITGALRSGYKSRGDDLFHLYLEELQEVLRGNTTALEKVPVGRATYQQYAALPPYSALIVGHFDPVRWAADPDRRTDVYDARGRTAPVSDTVTGFPGAPGIVESTARLIPTPSRATGSIPATSWSRR